MIVPCYNQATFVAEAVESAQKQRHPNIEVVLVDDGSTDDLQGVAEGFGEVRLIRQPNLGLAAARNNGFQASRGAFITFLDADDRLLPDAISVNLLHLRDNPSWVFVSGEHRYIDREGRVLDAWTREPVETDHYARLLEGNYIGMCATVLYRREILEEYGGFDSRRNPCEDYDLYLRIARHRPIGNHATLVAEYRRYGSAMSDNIGRMLQATVSTLRAHAGVAHMTPSLEQSYRKGLDWWRGYYAGPLREQLRKQLRSGQINSRVFRDAICLLEYSPVDFLRLLSGR